jgi:hypothetical protein
MSDLHYYQYAFAQPNCRVETIGPGVDPRFDVELIGDGPIAAVASRFGLDRFDPEKLQGRTPEEVRWLGEIAARHNEIICHAADSSAVLPLRMGTVFRSHDSLRATLSRFRPTVSDFLRQLGDRQEWGIKLYLRKARLDAKPVDASPPSPHFFALQSGASYLAQKKAQLESRRESQAAVRKTIETVERRLTGIAERCCRVRNLPSDLTGRADEMVFNAAFLLPSSSRENWLETVQGVGQEVCSKGLSLEVSGPWPPYHFCPTLEM